MIRSHHPLLGILCSLLTLGHAVAGPGTYYNNRSSGGASGKEEDAQFRSRAEFQKEADKVKRRVAELRKRLEEWGSVTVSAPIIMKEIGQFNLGPEMSFPSTLQYINLALTSAQGGVSQSTATAFSNQLELTVTPTFAIDPVTGEKRARPMPPNDNSLTPDAVAQGPQFNLQSVLASAGTGTTAGQFAAPGSLIVGPNGEKGVLKPGTGGVTGLTPNSSFMLSGAQAAMIGSNAKLFELLMREMADPKQRLFTNPDNQIHFAIVQVSCNPGWRTRENYIADVSATCEYFHAETARPGDEYPGRVVQGAQRTPRVFSVLPLIDAQTLELQNGERRFTQLAASLAAAYPTAAANLKGRDIMQFVKQFQKDTQTVSPRTVANSYSSGSTFGFRLMPSLTALKDPARSGSKPANILQATSFPVLVTVVISTKDALDLKANAVRVNIANRWLINDRPPAKEFWRRIGLPLWRESTTARVDLAMDYGEAKAWLQQVRDRTPWDNPYYEATATLERDLHELRHKILGVNSPVFCLPRDRGERIADEKTVISRPVVQRVIPDTLATQGSASLFISGLNFFHQPDPTKPYVRGEKDPDTSQIDVYLGQLKGKVRLCNGDDHLVVEFDNLDKLAGMESASLVVLTGHGAIGWGQAVKLLTPLNKTDKPAIAEVKVEKVKPDKVGNYTQLKAIIAGNNLSGVRGAKFKGEKALTDVFSAQAPTVSAAESLSVTVVLDFEKPPDTEQKGVLELYKDKEASGEALLRTDLVVPAKKP